MHLSETELKYIDKLRDKEAGRKVNRIYFVAAGILVLILTVSLFIKAVEMVIPPTSATMTTQSLDQGIETMQAVTASIMFLTLFICIGSLGFIISYIFLRWNGNPREKLLLTLVTELQALSNKEE